MPTIQENNKRIAKNTLLLYVRLLLTLVIGLFTSRVILNTLGISDYGINNVVAGFVSMFGLLTSSLSVAISRYITVSLGKNEVEQLKVIFSSSVTIMLVMAVVVILIAEPIGIWFVNTQMNIPNGRMYAANWVFQLALLAFAINMISVPYNATIVAHERMDAFAYISILEVTLKLVIVYMLYISPFDKLITYSVLFAGVALLIRLIYGFYCDRHFEEAHYKLVLDKGLLKNMGGFAGWNFVGTGTYIINTQGVNMIMNIFFGVTANAARGVANQVEGILKQFVSNFMTAINPQIMKSYASGDLQYMHSLICRGAKFSYLLMLLFVVPFMFETETIMKLWLKNYPPLAPLFLRLSLVGTLMDMLGSTSYTAALASGNIKHYYIIVGSISCLVFPLSWIAFALGAPAYTSYIVFIIVYLILTILRINIIKGLVGFNPRMYNVEVVYKIIPATIAAFLVPGLLFSIMSPNIVRTLIVVPVGFLSAVISSYCLGLSLGERSKIRAIVVNKLNGITRR